jgi:hypothetical protein
MNEIREGSALKSRSNRLYRYSESLLLEPVSLSLEPIAFFGSLALGPIGLIKHCDQLSFELEVLVCDTAPRQYYTQLFDGFGGVIYEEAVGCHDAEVEWSEVVG